MTQIVGLSFKYVNEIHYVTNFNVALKVDDWVIAKTVRAKELGRVDVITNSLPDGKSEDGFAKTHRPQGHGPRLQARRGQPGA